MSSGRKHFWPKKKSTFIIKILEFQVNLEVHVEIYKEDQASQRKRALINVKYRVIANFLR